jgi:hypothetical protein
LTWKEEDLSHIHTLPPPHLLHVPDHNVDHPNSIPDHVRSTTPAVKLERYEWIGKDNTKDYMESIAKWKAHSNRASFTLNFDAITAKYRTDNNLRTSKIDDFLIAEALKAGVLKTHPIKI